MPVRKRRGDLDRSIGLTVLLFVAILVPSACVLWFMNEALTIQAAAARQDVLEAYRGQLRLVRGKIEAHWGTRAEALQPLAALRPDAALRRALREGRADSVVMPAHGEQPRASSEAALAAQAIVRERMRKGDREGALRAVEAHFMRGVAARGFDRDGRLIAADAYLLGAQLLPPGARRDRVIARLAALLNEDAAASMPLAQRVFLMGELQAIAPVALPTLDAERLALSVIEAGAVRPESGLRETGVAGVWQLASPDGRLVAIFRTATVERVMAMLLADYPTPGAQLAMLSPGRAANDDAIPAGPSLPDWHLSLTLSDPAAIRASVPARGAAYVTVGALAIALMIAIGVALGHALRRQARLARLKTDLVAAVSHELRTPLASMRLLVDELLSDEEIEPRKAREYLQLAAGENARLSRLIENFLAFSRLDRNLYRFSPSPAAPGEVVQAALEASRERMPHGAGLSVDVAPDLPAVSVDADALVTALVNLLDNAWKYTVGDRRVTVKAFAEAGEVVFAVQDNGIGIAPRDRKRIFDRFYQVDQRLARDTGGCGLGLSIVQSIVRAHGGTVGVESVPGEGSTFSIRIPAGGRAVAA